MTPKLVSLVRPERGRSPVTRIGVALLASLLLLSLMPTMAQPAKAQDAQEPDAPPQGLAASGPIDPENGYPFWYEDHDGTRLELCLDPSETSKCLKPFEMPDQAAQMTFPDNFPGESFWWTGEAHIERPDGGRALLVLAQEAAFANEEPRDGDQMAFGRIRIRLDQLQPGATYTVTHPYGVDKVVAEEDGSVFVTEDIGCAPSPFRTCSFDKTPVNGRIGPFLTWDTFSSNPSASDPALTDANGNRYVGDPDVEHRVKGSPYNTNFFKVEGPGLGTPGYIQTELFSVSGKLAESRVKAVGAGAERAQTVFNDADQRVALFASEPAARIYYARNDEQLMDPVNNEVTGTPYDPARGVSLKSDSSPGAAGGVKTLLKFLAVSADGQRSEVFSKTFEVDLRAPNVIFSKPSGILDGPQDIKLSASERARVYYTTDGSNPDPRAGTNPAIESFVYDPSDPTTAKTVIVNRSQTIRTLAADLDPVTGDGVNWSQPKSHKYQISNLTAGPINPQNGFPFWYEDRNGVRLDLCLNPIAAPETGGGYCATPFEMPAGWQPSDGVRFPDRFPGEAFWFTAESGMETSEDGEANLVMATEAAFLNEEPKASDRMVFGRIRIRIDDLVPGEKYTITHPYGTETFIAENDGKGAGEINYTEDIGCMMPSEAEPCDFGDAGFGRVGPYLTLKNGNEPTGPDGGRYLSNPVTDEDIVTGSPYDTNYFRVEGPGLQGSDETPVQINPVNNMPYIQTNFFSIVGKRSEFQAAASRMSGFYNAPTMDVTLGASEFDAEIYYTTDGSEPSTASARYSGPVPVNLKSEGPTELKYVAVVRNVDGTVNRQTPVYTETYTLDQTTPETPGSLTLATESDTGVAGDNRTNSVTPTLTGTAEPSSTVRIFVDGVQKGSGRANAITGAFSITTVPLSPGAHQVTATATDAAGNESVMNPAAPALTITIDNEAPMAPTVNPNGGTFNAPQQVRLSTESGATIYYTTGEAIPTRQKANRYTDPIQVSSSQTINAIAVDLAGNESPLASFDYVIATPNRAPAITILSPEPDSTIRDRTPTVRATVSDARTNLRKADIQLFVDGERMRPATYSYDRTRDRLTYIPRARLDLGRHTVRIVATDADDARTPKSWSFSIARR